MFFFNKGGQQSIDFLLPRALGLNIQCSQIYMESLTDKKKSDKDGKTEWMIMNVGFMKGDVART